MVRTVDLLYTKNKFKPRGNRQLLKIYVELCDSLITVWQKFATRLLIGQSRYHLKDLTKIILIQKFDSMIVESLAKI